MAVMNGQNSETESTAVPDEVRELDVLFRKYSGMTYRLCLRYTKDRYDAEDMVSEVFMKVGRKMGQYRGDATPMVWIYRIAVNTCLDHLRIKRSRQRLDLEDLDTHALKVVNGHGDRCHAKIMLERILKNVNPTTRRILFLNHLEGLSHGEIAKVLDVSREAVTKRLNRFSEQVKRMESEKDMAFKLPSPHVMEHALQLA